ncbi:hypothetical protein SASPL_135147 [Salvia splendens]|uniref:Large subunit ribosomal protein L13e n=1 Tax=Salvia splendens TaxID=180675 RepID=A0A8X8WZJ2_SALSN|nr:hypothetical protein SASPL_135147 [Salvia splendens]
MKHNNVIPNGHFKKHWQNYVKTWFNQPARKARRRNARQQKAIKIFPRPTAGPLRPVVRGQTLKYNMKVRAGRGFSLEELKVSYLTTKMHCFIQDCFFYLHMIQYSYMAWISSASFSVICLLELKFFITLEVVVEVYNLFALLEFHQSMTLFYFQCNQAAGIPKKLAPTIGIAVDHRRRNSSLEGFQTNVQRLKTFKAKLVVFPRRARKVKAGDSSPEELATATQVTGPFLPIVSEKPAIELVKVTEHMKSFKAYDKLRLERTNARHVGVRAKRAAEAEKEEKK